MTTSYNFKERQINADRICEGLSKIGYIPSSAIMDIVDNSVTADATLIDIYLDIKEDTPLNEKSNVVCFRVVDNGHGMDSNQIEIALDIGSDVSYPDNSLSKYGLGLKSAGFSLGEKISVLSKKDGKYTDTLYVDREIIRRENRYGICVEDPEENFVHFLNDYDSGTIVEISNTISPQDQASKIRNELGEKIGVTYYHFMVREENPLTINIHYNNHTDKIVPIDIMFSDDCLENFKHEEYKGDAPYDLGNLEIENPFNPDSEKIKLQMTGFPAAKMSTYPGFDKEKQSAISRYKVTRNNSGFFIFRNNRLIRWGDNLAGSGRDNINFRAKLSITTEHDNILHVDVSKQKLVIFDEIENTIEFNTRLPLQNARDMLKICSDIKDSGNDDEGQETDLRSKNIPEIILPSATETPEPDEKLKRRKELAEESKTKEEELKKHTDLPSDKIEPGIEEEANEPETEEFRKIIFSDAFMGTGLWIPGYDSTYESYVRINKNHPFYSLAISKLPAADATRISIEALLLMASIAENTTIQGYSGLNYDQMRKLFEHFRFQFSVNMEHWVMNNQDLY